MEDLHELARDVAQFRETEGMLRANYATLKKHFDEETATLKRNLDEAAIATAQAEKALRDAMIDRFEEDGNKKQIGGTIRVVKRLIYDAQRALAYAFEHKMFLKLDASAFEKYAKDTPPEFVEIVTETTAALDSDLSEFIKEEK